MTGTMAPAPHLAHEVSSQPDAWARVVSRLGELSGVLPQPGRRVATIGCGTSWFMGQAYAALREAAGHGVTDAWSASDHRLARGYDHVVVICRSGTTTEVMEVVDHLRAEGTPVTAFVATAGTPIAEAAASAAEATGAGCGLVLMADVDERSVVQTRFATTTLALLRASLGEDLTPVIDQARAVLAENEADAVGHLVAAEQVTFLGTGWSTGIAHEAALKLRESTQSWAESYSATEYRHGPISIAGPGRVTWALGAVPSGLREQVTATGAHFEHRDVDPLAELVRVHRLCLARARRNGMDPDQPRHLTRSVILDPPA